MKVRTDFVTNSSSSSFIVRKKNLTKEQLQIIRDPEEIAEKLGICEWGSPLDWSIEETENSIIGWTTMDNFDWIEFLGMIGVNDIEYEPDDLGAGSWGLSTVLRYEKENNVELISKNWGDWEDED